MKVGLVGLHGRSVDWTVGSIVKEHVIFTKKKRVGEIAQERAPSGLIAPVIFVKVGALNLQLQTYLQTLLNESEVIYSK